MPQQTSKNIFNMFFVTEFQIGKFFFQPLGSQTPVNAKENKGFSTVAPSRKNKRIRKKPYTEITSCCTPTSCNRGTLDLRN